jgi:hypothetical protein
MRIEVEIPDEKVDALREHARRTSQRFEDLLQDAVDRHLAILTEAAERADRVWQEAHQTEKFRRNRALDAAFGIMGDRTVDGLEYQRKLRNEWDHRG